MEIDEVTPFRYCEIEGYKENLKINELTQLVVNNKFDDEASSFCCDNEVLNKIWDFVNIQSRLHPFQGYYIDGDRERTPYEADALINQLCHYANDSE